MLEYLTTEHLKRKGGPWILLSSRGDLVMPQNLVDRWIRPHKRPAQVFASLHLRLSICMPETRRIFVRVSCLNDLVRLIPRSKGRYVLATRSHEISRIVKLDTNGKIVEAPPADISTLASMPCNVCERYDLINFTFLANDNMRRRLDVVSPEPLRRTGGASAGGVMNHDGVRCTRKRSCVLFR